MKLKTIIFMSALILMITAFYAYSQDEVTNDEVVSEEVIRIDNLVFDHPQRPGAVFDHDDHNEKAMLEDDCSVCHHVYENKKLIEGESSEDSLCSECHSLKTTQENFIPLRMAFHNRCKTCHFDVNKGPVLCGECHIKK